MNVLESQGITNSNRVTEFSESASMEPRCPANRYTIKKFGGQTPPVSSFSFTEEIAKDF